MLPLKLNDNYILHHNIIDKIKHKLVNLLHKITQ